MPTFRYTSRAERELAEILESTKGEWGEAQAQKYFQQLADTFNLLSQYPKMGRKFSAGHADWRRFEQGSHVVIYRPTPDGVVIQRLMHKRQLITRSSRLV